MTRSIWRDTRLVDCGRPDKGVLVVCVCVRMLCYCYALQCLHVRRNAFTHTTKYPLQSSVHNSIEWPMTNCGLAECSVCWAFHFVAFCDSCLITGPTIALQSRADQLERERRVATLGAIAMHHQQHHYIGINYAQFHLSCRGECAL